MKTLLMMALTLLGCGVMIGCDHDVQEARLDNHTLQPVVVPAVDSPVTAPLSATTAS